MIDAQSSDGATLSLYTLVLVIFVAHQTFKIRPIWSHYGRSDPETTLYLHSERPTIHFPTFLVRLSAALNTYSALYKRFHR